MKLLCPDKLVTVTNIVIPLLFDFLHKVHSSTHIHVKFVDLYFFFFQFIVTAFLSRYFLFV